MSSIAVAQNTTTVRDNEFRSRWADFQIDRPQSTIPLPPNGNNTGEEQTGLFEAFARSSADFFRNGPLQLRSNLSTGWEYSNEKLFNNAGRSTTDRSFFLAPSIGVFYNQERGPVAISARYSAGYVFYLDQKYVAANGAGGIFSNTGGLDIKVDGLRSSLASSAGYSYGQGLEIESGVLRDQFSASETLTASYLIDPLTRVGLTGGVGYSSYRGGGVAGTETITDTAAVYFECAYSPKTHGRVELATGQEYQTGNGPSAGSNTADRSYYQALLSADYFPSPKLNMSFGAGYGVQDDSNVLGRARSGSHPIYRVTVTYAPTPKTTASARFGYEGVDTAPSFGLQVDWHFRATTSASLSVYQDTNFSTYLFAQNLLTRGALAGIQQRLFGVVDLSLSGGVEQSEGDGRVLPSQQPYNQDPFLFAGVSFQWKISRYLACQTYYRGYGGRGGVAGQQSGLQSRAAVSLRLTF